MSQDQTWLGRFGQQLRFAVVRTAQLVPAFSDLPVLLQNPIHGTDRAAVTSLVQKRRPHLGGCLVDEPLRVQCTEHLRSLCLVERSVGPRTTLRLGHARLSPAIQRGTGYPQRLAGFRGLSNPSRQLLGRRHQSFSSLSRGFRGIPRSSEAFFWISSIVSTRARRRFRRAGLEFVCVFGHDEAEIPPRHQTRPHRSRRRKTKRTAPRRKRQSPRRRHTVSMRPCNGIVC